MAGGRSFVCKQERAVAVRKLDPEGAWRFAHFSQAVLVEVPGPTLYVAGQGDVTGDFEIQARRHKGRSSNGRRAAFRRKLSSLPQRFDQTALVGNALARDIEGRSMIDRSTDHRQADGYVHAGLQSQHLYRAMTLIMIHRNDHV